MSMSIKQAKTRMFAFAAMLLLAFSLVGGPMTGSSGSFATPVAAEDVNDLWNEVTADSVGGKLNQNNVDSMNTLVSKAQAVAKTITSILTLVSFVSLLWWIAKLALSAGNARERQTALTGIFFSGVALALFGGAWVVVSFFWNLLSSTGTAAGAAGAGTTPP